MSSEESSFQVVYPGSVRKKLEKILIQAKKVGKLAKFLRAVAEIDRRLHSDPREFGELKSQLPWLNLQMHVGFVRPLMVEFGIQEKKKLVFVKRLESVTTLGS